jgi:hypothetical protein
MSYLHPLKVIRSLSPSIFKAYDIRGVVGKTLNAGIAKHIGQAFGSAVRAKGESTVVVGRDGLLFGPELSAAGTRPAKHRCGCHRSRCGGHAHGLFRNPPS